MDYIEKSLAGGEKVVLIGRFHWIYMAGAFFWVIFGMLLCVLIMAGAIAWSVNREMDVAYPNLPSHLFWQGWSEIVGQKGGYIALIRDQHAIVRFTAFGALLGGFLLFAHMMIIRATTEIAVTTNRLVLKEGIVARNVDEMNIDRIESVHVIQSVLGRMLDYGTVMVRGMGIGEIVLPPLASPIVFRNAIDKAKQTDRGKIS